MRDTKNYSLFSGYDASTATFTAATTDIITSSAHGLSNGDTITVSSTTTLPAGLSANTVYYVLEATTNTFKLSTTHIPNGQGTAVDITDTGTGTHTWVDSTLSRVIFGDGRHVSVTLSASGTVAMTVQLVTSDQEDAPNFLAAAVSTNQYDTTETIDLQSGNAGAGDGGISGGALAATGTIRYAVNTDQSRWIALKISAHTNGTLDANGRVAND